MKIHLILALVAFVCSSLAQARTFPCPEAGVSIVLPDDWVRGRKGELGEVILPKNGANQKVRIHVTIFRQITAEQAILNSVTQVNELRKQDGQPFEKIFESVPVVTKSGMAGQKAAIGPDKPDAKPYLNRYYFLKPDGSFFCVGVYYYGDADFEKLCHQAILETLAFTSP